MSGSLGIRPCPKSAALMKWLRKFWSKARARMVVTVPVSASPPVCSEEPVAFISDIHANLQALEAVIADIQAQGVREVVCLGDIVGYGGNPTECVNLIRAAGISCVRGNHDAFAGGTTPLPTDSGDLEAACQWMRRQLGEDNCRWLGNLPFTFSGDDFDAVHASLHQPERWNYLDIAPAAALHFKHQVKPVSFVGHTHQPKMWIEGMELPSAEGGIESLRCNRLQVVNIGSVGQPRDEDERACYTIYRRKEREICWRRVTYDIDGAQRAIIHAGLPPRHATRLELGN